MKLVSILLLTMALTTGISATAQTSRLGSWNVINAKISLSKHWRLFTEAQLRSQSFYSDHFYYEVKGGISYNIGKKVQVLVGTGKYITYDSEQEGNFPKPITSNETRLWQQFTLNHDLGRIQFEHRYRIEQRFYTDEYRNRFRYRLGITIPVNKKEVESGTFYVTAFDEVFLTNKAPYFSRNRLLAGAGYQFNDIFTLQPAYVYQFDYDSDNTGFGKHFFHLTAMIDIDKVDDLITNLPAAFD